MCMRSRPARGAWIEIQSGSDDWLDKMSRPARGAWIEITEHGYIIGVMVVAPRKGRVD